MLVSPSCCLQMMPFFLAVKKTVRQLQCQISVLQSYTDSKAGDVTEEQTEAGDTQTSTAAPAAGVLTTSQVEEQAVKELQKTRQYMVQILQVRHTYVLDACDRTN